MKKQLLTILTICILCAMNITAQETIFRSFPPTTYQGGTQNWDILQMPNGQMAIANNNGLLIYNGAQWSLYPIKNYTTVRALYYDHNTDRLYAGASDEFGYYYVDRRSRKFCYHSLSDKLPAKKRGFGEIWKILEWNGRMVFQSKSHLFILYKDGKYRTFRPKLRIETMALVGNRLILATRRGLEQLSTTTTTTLLPGAKFKKKIVVRDIIPYKGQLLVATQQNAIMTYDGHTLSEDKSAMAPMLRQNQIFCAEIRGSRLAIGTVRAGLIVKDLNGGRELYLNSSKGLRNNTILAATFDYDGNIWLGLDNGLSCALINVPFQNIVSDRANIGMGYTSIVHDGTLYLGTNQGVFVQDMPLRQQLIYKSPQPVSGVTGQIWELSAIDGTLLCCADQGLFAINGTQAKRIEGPDGVWEICQLKKHPGYILAADYLGVVVLKHQGNTFSTVGRVKSDIESIGNIIEDTDGTLWSSHWQKGIYHWALSSDMKSIKTLQHFDSKNGLVIDQTNLLCKIRGKIYVSCVDGLYTYNRNTRKLVYDKRMSQVFNTYGSSLKITETPNHDLWAQKGDFIAIAHAKGNGYVVDSTSYRGIAKTQQLSLGNMSALDEDYSLVNSNDGFYLVKNFSQHKKHSYPLLISKITSISNGDSIVYRHINTEKNHQVHLSLSHSLNSIRIEFVSPEYVAEDAITYSYYLENYDERWNSTNANYKEYTQLNKGTYVFHLKAFNRISGKTLETSIKITIEPAWYESVWAYLLYTIVAGFMAYGLLRYLKFRADRELMIERTKRKAEAAEAENEKLQTELKHKSSELASSTMSSIHQNDILQKIDEDMATLSESVRREDKKAIVTSKINDIRNNLQSYLNNDEGWEKFEENFNVVYDDYMKKLTERFPTLKQSDRKLCAYLRMGLNSKEMAALLNMSVRSIETARYRLRKKLDLESGENLTDFLQNFK